MSHYSHKLDLYRWAVQHPPAEVAFLQRAYAHCNDGRWPTRLKEDFAGSAAIAAQWAAMDENHRAIAVESHAPTARRAERWVRRLLGTRADDCPVVCADVHEFTTPKVDVVAALNFSAFIFHDRAALRDYLRAARRSLRPGGIVVLDAYGGPGAMRVGEQRRIINPDEAEPFEYRWEQRSYDAVTSRVDCRIHFAFPDGHVSRNAFRYDWRLWSLTELIELMHEAGFTTAQAWCDRYDARRGQSDGRYEPVATMAAREDWVAYGVGKR